MILVKCTCGRRLQVPEKLRGKQVKCPSCGHEFVVSGGGADDAFNWIGKPDVSRLQRVPEKSDQISESPPDDFEHPDASRLVEGPPAISSAVSAPPPLPNPEIPRSQEKKRGCCPRCGKPTKFYSRDLSTGLCWACQAADRDAWKKEQSLELFRLKYSVSKTIRGVVATGDILDLLAEKLQTEACVERTDEQMTVTGFNQWLGGINYVATAKIACKTKNDRTTITASLEQRPTGWFYLFLILGICFAVIGVIIPMFMYYIGKNFAIKQMERTFDECADELG